MAQWWELSLEELKRSEEHLEQARMACFNTFYASQEGRDVLIFLARLCYEEKSSPEASLALISLYHDIKFFCGATIEAERAALDSEAQAIEGDLNAS